MKEFDIELAKAGAPLCTRKGRDARIICWDMAQEADDTGRYAPIIALIKNGGNEYLFYYYKDGRYSGGCEDYDLMIKDEEWDRLQGWKPKFKEGEKVRFYTPEGERRGVIKEAVLLGVCRCYAVCMEDDPSKPITYVNEEFLRGEKTTRRSRR